MEVRVGCSGWSYDSWVGPFYPTGSRPSDLLRLYSLAFDTVEIDSTFYRSPNQFAVRSWNGSTPSSFLFAVKMPKQITHESGFASYERQLDFFLSSIRGLGPKLGPVLVQLPPSFSYETGWKTFRPFLAALPEDACFAVEFRDNSWFRADVYSSLEARNITLVWSEIPAAKPPAVLTSSMVYLRLIADRSIREKDFGRVSRTRRGVVREWVNRLRSVEDKVRRAFVFSNNHFQGFGPATVNLVREELGLEQVDWTKRILTSPPEGQRTLFDS